MFKNVDQLKDFLIWAKTQGIQSVKVKDAEIHFSAVSMLPAETLKELTDGAATFSDTEPNDKRDDEESLYWSSKL